jgi:cytochrome c biogenesis protein CcdA/thiol-disulfide isomerase/thioredoxin
MITLIAIGLVGGLITGISPCVLPVLPVVFLSGGVGRADSETSGAPADARAAWRNRRPYLIVAGLAISFSVFTLLGTLALSALPVPKDIIRWGGLAALVLLGGSMLFPWVQAQLERPFARLGRRSVRGRRNGFVLGLALGAVYVPCAGPVLAAITVAGATGHIGVRTVALTVAFAIGTAIPLLFFALAGGAIVERLRLFRERQRRVQIAAGLLIIALAVALTFNVTDALQRSVPDYTASLNRSLDGNGAIQLSPDADRGMQVCAQEPVLEQCGAAPAVSGIGQWLNTGGKTLSLPALAGKVVLVDFWAYSCINCQRAIPHVEAWYSAYKSAGLVVLGIHTPEYAFEHVASNVGAAGKRLGITYPIGIDNNYTTWNNFGNNAWPAEYLIDGNGQIRHIQIGEGDYPQTETMIRQLLSAQHPGVKLAAGTDVADTTPSFAGLTRETHFGTSSADGMVFTQSLRPGRQSYTFPAAIGIDDFALDGTWDVGPEAVTAVQSAGIRINFQARSAYLDAGGSGTVTVTVDGKTTTVAVSGVPDLYPLVLKSPGTRRMMTIEASPGVVAYSLSFG